MDNIKTIWAGHKVRVIVYTLLFFYVMLSLNFNSFCHKYSSFIRWEEQTKAEYAKVDFPVMQYKRQVLLEKIELRREINNNHGYRVFRTLTGQVTESELQGLTSDELGQLLENQKAELKVLEVEEQQILKEQEFAKVVRLKEITLAQSYTLGGLYLWLLK